jgi:23S rRNA pseudouridine955/2504/2580 synthase
MDIQPVKVFPTEDGVRLNRWFLRHYPRVLPAEFHKLCRTGQIRVNAGRVRGNQILYSGDLVRIPPFAVNVEKNAVQRKKQDAGDHFSLSDLEALRKCIIHADSDLVAFNKPAGLAVQGGTKVKMSLDKMAQALYPYDTVLLVHRLDKETSGVLVVARNQKAAKELSAEFKNKQVSKEYLALLSGTVPKTVGVIDNFMLKGQVLDEDEAAAYQKMTNGKLRRAITKYRVLGQLPGSVTWMLFMPKTGRTHQLRLHAAKTLGAPIVGDDLYGQARGDCSFADVRLRSLIDGRHLFLCAHKLSFRHPGTGRIVTMRAELPDFMRHVVQFLEFEVPD